MATVCLDWPISYDDCKADRLMDKMNDRIHSKEKFFSLEFFPPRTLSGTCNLFEKCSRLSQGQPLFCDVACNLSTQDPIGANELNSFVDVASTTQDITNVDTMVQLNTAQVNEESVTEILCKARRLGISNVMAMSEGGYHNAALTKSKDESDDFFCTADLVRYIRSTFGNAFSICVAGYPSCLKVNQTCPYEQSMQHLLLQVECGADFIITQMLFDANEFFEFVSKCRSAGVKIPIIPGIFPIQSFGCIRQLCRLSNVQIPEKIMNVLKPIQHNDEAVLKYGIFLTVELCRLLLQSALCVGLHFFTLNREVATTEILKRVGLWKEQRVSHRVLPWLHAGHDVRDGENVRPIFWACRPESYQYRTKSWEEFPNGRWGNSSHAAFGSFKDYHLFYVAGTEKLDDCKKMWGETLESMVDVCDVFAAFISCKENKNGVKVTAIPWSEEDIAPETSVITDELAEINSVGILTINSQPNVNCASSNDKTFGWGSPGGFVFQKAYLEFFCCEEDGKNLLTVLPDYPSVNYHIVNQAGTVNYSNHDCKSAIAVTWGVFTGRMVLQPTVVDPIAFDFWKDEAFELWTQQWGRLYAPSSTSRQLIENIQNTFYLVNLVDNDYVRGNCLFPIIKRVVALRKS